MPVDQIFEKLYRALSRHRALLFGIVLVLIGASLAGLARLDVEENIEAMLPDGSTGVAADFRLLQSSPFARKVLVHLRAEPGTGTDVLLQSADRLAAAMQPPFFSRAVAGPAGQDNGRLLPRLLDSLPNLLDESDLQRLAQELTPAGIERHLREGYAQMLGPQGWLVKDLVRRDPLELRTFALQKLRYVNPVEKTRLREGRFVTGDGRHALIIAETDIPITDAEGGRRLMDHFDELVREALAPGIGAEMVSGHRYTVANAETIKADLAVVLGVSLAALVGLFLVFMRDRRALCVLLVPVAVVGFAAVAVALAYESVSGITLGFGAVLLGITVDFALHVYFALRSDGGAPAAAVGRIARPVLYGGLTTVGAFAVLLGSDLPGQRQLAVFSVTGIAVSLLLSLVVLPHLVGVGKGGGLSGPAGIPGMRLPRFWIIGGWLAVMGVCGWQATQVTIDGELRKLTRVPTELRTAEKELQRNWGNLRGKAMLFATGEDLQAALERNDRLFAFLRAQGSSDGLVSVAGVLPARSTQEENREHWDAFWRKRGDDVERMLQERGGAIGFSPTAFTPFSRSFRQSPEPVSRDLFRAFGLEDLFNAMVMQDGGRTRVMTLVPDGGELMARFDADPPPVPGVRLVSQSRFGAEIGRAIERDFVRFILSAGAMVLVLLLVLFRSVKKAAAALLPVATGLVVMFGVMALFGLAFNLFNIVATILVIGLGIDYGIFMVCRAADGLNHGTEKAVLVSGLTTLAGFGALTLARHPALHSIGVTVLLGITPAVLSALLVIPAIYRKETA